METALVNLILAFVPSSKWRKILRNKFLETQLPSELFYYLKRSSYGNKHVYLGQDGADVIYKELCKDKPCLITRFGVMELGIMKQFLENKKRQIHFGQKECVDIAAGGGLFPINDYILSRFSSEMYDIISEIDVLGVWFNRKEEKIIPKYCSEKTKIIDKDCLGDLIFEKPWSRYLKGKKVLVIHPFVETIKFQYEKRKLLFENPETLPDFELILLKAVQSMADEKNNLPFSTWFEALDYMKEQIKAIDFDVAIIGAGAYGMFLAQYCKELGKKAIHVGGATQVLFGIKGRRWDETGIYNEHWVRPSETETPKGASKVEGGCYW